MHWNLYNDQEKKIWREMEKWKLFFEKMDLPFDLNNITETLQFNGIHQCVND